MAPMGLDSPIAGRVGTQHFFPRIATILFDSFRASPARTRVTFSSAKKWPKRRRGHPGPRFFAQSDFFRFEIVLPLN